MVAGDLDGRRRLALERTRALISGAEERSTRAWKNYYVLQMTTIVLAAITPCLIVLAKENPRNELFNWLQLFLPAIAAIAAGLTHVFRWREDGVRFANLAESVRGILWRFETRTGECGPTLSDDQALDYLVTHVEALNREAIERAGVDRSGRPSEAHRSEQPAAGLPTG